MVIGARTPMRRWGLYGIALLAGWGALWLARPGAPIPVPPPTPAGQTQAAPPFLMDRMVAGIDLKPAPRRLAGECRLAANELGFPVPCPQLLPTNPATMDEAVAAYAMDRLFVFQDEHFAVPSEDSQARDTVHGGHLLIVAYRTRDAVRLQSVHSAYFCPPRGRGRAAFLGNTFVQGVPAFFESCAKTARPNDYSLLDGHFILQWFRRGVTYEMSVHGQTLGHQELLEYLGPFLTYVSPG